MFCSDSHPFLKENQMDRLFLDLVRDQIGSQECSPQILHWRIYIPYLWVILLKNPPVSNLADLTLINWVRWCIVSRLEGTRCYHFDTYCAFNSHIKIAIIMKA
jgi:hypothetical protein